MNLMDLKINDSNQTRDLIELKLETQTTQKRQNDLTRLEQNKVSTTGEGENVITVIFVRLYELRNLLF